MAKVCAKVGVKREPGYLYFIDKKGNVSRAKMARGRKKGKGKIQTVAKVGVKKEKGFLYFLDKKGNVSCAKMARGGKKKKKAKKPAKKKASTKKVAKAKKHTLNGVAIDCSKHFHRVIIFDFNGMILTEPFSIDSLKSGYVELKKQIRNSTRKLLTDNIYIAIELSGVCSENLLISSPFAISHKNI